MNPNDIMTKKEITQRARNQLQYKYDSLVSNYSNSETNHKDNEEIIKDYKNKLDWLKNIKSKINTLFLEEFPDEPTDEEINNEVLK